MMLLIMRLLCSSMGFPTMSNVRLMRFMFVGRVRRLILRLIIFLISIFGLSVCVFYALI